MYNNCSHVLNKQLLKNNNRSSLRYQDEVSSTVVLTIHTESGDLNTTGLVYDESHNGMSVIVVEKRPFIKGDVVSIKEDNSHSRILSIARIKNIFENTYFIGMQFESDENV